MAESKKTPLWVQIVLYIILAASVCFTIFDAVRNLTAKPDAEIFADTLNQGSYAQGTGAYPTGEFFAVRHTVSGLIPIRTEWYYMVFNRKESDYIVVRAEKNWDEKVSHFGADFEIEGRVRTLPAGGKKAVLDALGELNKSALPVTYVYVDTLARSNAVMTLTAWLMIALGICGIYFIGMKNRLTSIGKTYRNIIHAIAIVLTVSGGMLIVYALC